MPTDAPEQADPHSATRIAAQAMSRYLPGAARAQPCQQPVQDVLMVLYTHHSLHEPILVPAVVEPLLVLVRSGAARVEERSLGGSWQASLVSAGDFFLTHTRTPYEMRWQSLGGDSFEVMHLYLGLPLIERAARDVLGEGLAAVALNDVSGARNEPLRHLFEHLHSELARERQASHLMVQSLAQALAVHLVRKHGMRQDAAQHDSALQAYKLRRVIEAMQASLDEAFCLAQLARVADLSPYHFSRLFKRATGLSPSQYFIRLRISRARQLLLSTDRSIIDIGLEVGYASPSHFSQVFRRATGHSPSAFRRA